MVSTEALMCGTPVICTDWGAFTETIPQGRVGYRCRTFDDFIWAVNNVEKIDPAECRKYAVSNFSIDRVAKSYKEYFIKVQDQLQTNKRWYAEHSERQDLDWLRRY